MRNLALHMIGDYLLQSDWMATKKTTSHKAAAAHAVAYTIPFLTRTRKPIPILMIGISHFFIDRYRLARYVVWAKNFLAPKGQDHEMTPTGMPSSTPPFLAVWLLIITDNLIHTLINAFALRNER